MAVYKLRKDPDLEEALTRALADQYVHGINVGYDAAVSDYYHDPDNDGGNWDSNRRTLHRMLGALKRWYGTRA